MFLDHLSIRTKALIPVVVMALTVVAILVITGAQTSSFTAAANDMIGRQVRAGGDPDGRARGQPSEAHRLPVADLRWHGFRAERQGKENLRRCARPDQRPPGRGRASPPEPRASDFPVCQAVRRDRRGREISVGYWPERFWGWQRPGHQARGPRQTGRGRPRALPRRQRLDSAGQRYVRDHQRPYRGERIDDQGPSGEGASRSFCWRRSGSRRP